jgi:hypothetical protein
VDGTRRQRTCIGMDIPSSQYRGEPNMNDVCRLVSTFAPFFSLTVSRFPKSYTFSSLKVYGHSLKRYDILTLCRMSYLLRPEEPKTGLFCEYVEIMLRKS